MPSTEGLKAVVISDFTPGLYNATDWLVPAKGWQRMENCYPQIGGGLRAFYNADAFGPGIPSTGENANTRPLGMFSSGGLYTDVVGADIYLVLYYWATGAGTPWVYRWNGTLASPSWEFLYRESSPHVLASDSDNNPSKASIVVFYTQPEPHTFTRTVVLMIRYDGADSTIWAVNFADAVGVLDQVDPPAKTSGSPFGAQNGSICVHQQRLVCASSGDKPELIWSDPMAFTWYGDGGVDSPTYDNFLDVDLAKGGNNILALFGVEPSDLLVLRMGAPMVTVQGDLQQAPVVQVADQGIATGNTGYTDFCSTPYGLAFISSDGYMYITDGHTNTKLSEQLARFEISPDFAGYGDIVYMGDFLFCPGERVYDFRTKSWFQQTAMTSHIKCGNTADNQVIGYTADGVLQGPDSPDGAFLVEFIPDTDTTRQSTFTCQTAPVHGTDGRLLCIRMVEVNCKSYDLNATISCTVNGTTKTQTLRTVGRQNVRFLFSEQAQTLDATFVSTSGTGDEAPSFDDVVLWTRSGHFSPN